MHKVSCAQELPRSRVRVHFENTEPEDPGMLGHAYHPIPQESRVRGWTVQDQPGQYSTSPVSLEYGETLSQRQLSQKHATEMEENDLSSSASEGSQGVKNQVILCHFYAWSHSIQGLPRRRPATPS